MSATISVGKAKPKLHDLIEQARKGRTHIITVHDQPCAQLGPIESRSRKLTNEWRKRVQRRNIRLNAPGKKRLTISQLIQERRK
jgi:antitoxin (DNA-binding transcriptional repressor) of toxin-antitoxin stability system